MKVIVSKDSNDDKSFYFTLFLMSKYLWYTQIVWFDFQRGDEEAEDVASSPVVARTDNNGTDSPITYYGSSCYAKLGVARPEVVLDRGE